MQLPLSHNIRFMRFFGSAKQTYAYRFVGNFYLRQPFAVFFANAKKTAFIAWLWFSVILSVFYAGNFPKIIKSIVRSNTINMVNLFCRPISFLVQPRQSVRQMKSVVQSDNHIPVFGYAPCFSPDAAFSPGLRPRKKPGVSVVIEQFMQSFWGHAVNINSAVCGGQA